MKNRLAIFLYGLTVSLSGFAVVADVPREGSPVRSGIKATGIFDLRRERQNLDDLIAIGTAREDLVATLESYDFQMHSQQVANAGFRNLYGAYEWTGNEWVSLTPDDFFSPCDEAKCELIIASHEYPTLIGVFHHTNRYLWLIGDRSVAKVSVEHSAWGWK